MNSKLWVGVYRRLDNRAEDLSDDSARAVELHNRRKKALHDALDDGPVWDVKNWGYTDDEKPHEFVELALDIVTSPYFQAVALPALSYIGKKLLDAAVDEILIKPVRELIARLRGKQKQEQILDFHIKLPEGTTIRCDPGGDDATLTLQFSTGKQVTLTYNASKEEIDKLN